MRRTRKLWLTASAVGGMLLLVAACSSGGGSPSSSSTSATSAADLVSAANQEGTVTWYSSIDINATKGVIAAFEKEYPKIKVSALYEPTEDLWERFETENAAKKDVADVIGLADWQLINEAESDHLLAEYIPPSVSDAVKSGVLPKQDVDSAGYYYASRELVIALAYDSSKVPAADAPKTWNDLTNSWWTKNGYIGILDPAKTTGAYYSYYAMNQAGIAQSFFSGIGKAQHKVKLYDSGGSIENALSSGEIQAAVITDYSAWALIQSGLPVKVVYPSSGVGASYDYDAVAANAPHPDAARLFDDFLGSTAGATAIAKSLDTYMVRTDVPPFPAGRPAITSIKVLPLNISQAASDRTAFLTTFQGWLGEQI